MIIAKDGSTYDWVSACVVSKWATQTLFRADFGKSLHYRSILIY